MKIVGNAILIVKGDQNINLDYLEIDLKLLAVRNLRARDLDD